MEGEGKLCSHGLCEPMTRDGASFHARRVEVADTKVEMGMWRRGSAVQSPLCITAITLCVPWLQGSMLG